MCSYLSKLHRVIPKEASFMMHALVVQSYQSGAWYPKGGSSEIAFHIIPVIKKSGGDVLMRAPVQRILINKDGQACGVTVKKGKEEINLFAPVVISDAGIFNTYERLLPQELQPIQAQLSMVRHGMGGFSVFVGLDGSKEELGLKAQNYWFYHKNNIDELHPRPNPFPPYIILILMTGSKYCTLSKEDITEGYPFMFVSFPSAKDPAWDARYTGKSNMVIVTLAHYEWFEEWKDERVKKRGEDYESLKMDIARKLMDRVIEYFPQLKDRIEYIRVGSPLSHEFYIASSRGEIYGANHDVSRFKPEVIASLRAGTPIKNLYLT
eukprot:g47346.t1